MGSDHQEVRWIPVTAQDAMACATLSIVAEQQSMPLVAETLRFMAAAYDECYLDVDPDLLEM